MSADRPATNKAIGKRMAASRIAGGVLALLAAAAAIPAHADSDGERAALSRLAKEIEALEPLVLEAERQADATDRRRFAYDWFKKDMASIKAGILEHLERPREPKPTAPLSGGYRR